MNLTVCGGGREGRESKVKDRNESHCWGGTCRQGHLSQQRPISLQFAPPGLPLGSVPPIQASANQQGNRLLEAADGLREPACQSGGLIESEAPQLIPWVMFPFGVGLLSTSSVQTIDANPIFGDQMKQPAFKGLELSFLITKRPT